ncbi:unnamed protein product [Cylindrotheca closterium]|uniref:Uncharacterized protein n=1 Tax=Cylindrotheca closterium TaxID=2856 RepID=A0AAD2JMF7_9STRA|nr:unnamed protein product [Cylindrotheca closterium]
MKDSIIKPPEKDPNSTMTDNPAITTPKRSSKRYPSETAKDGAMKRRSLFPSEVAQGQDVPTVNTQPNPTTPSSIDLTKDNPPDPTTSKSQRKQPPSSKTAKDGTGKDDRSLPTSQNSRFALLLGIFALVRPEFLLLFDPTLIVQRAEPLTWMWLAASKFFANPWTGPAIIPHIVEESKRLKREPTIAKAQSKFKKRLVSMPEHPTGAEAHDSPENLHPSNEPMEFVEIVWHALTTAFPTKQGWNQNELLSYLHTTTILFYDVCAAHQKWSPTMDSNEKNHKRWL